MCHCKSTTQCYRKDGCCASGLWSVDHVVRAVQRGRHQFKPLLLLQFIFIYQSKLHFQF